MDVNSYYDLLVWSTGAVAFGLAFIGYRYSGDSFHPALLLGIPLAYPCFLAPLLLQANGVIALYLPMQDMGFVQLVYLIGLASLLGGTLAAGRPRARHRQVWTCPAALRTSLRQAGWTLGLVAIAGYTISIYHSGGFTEVYSLKHHGAGLGLSGYVRSLRWFAVPGIVFIFLSSAGRRFPTRDIWVIAAFATPLVLRAVLTGGRGTAFVVVACLATGWYLTRGTRPRLVTVLIGGLCLALVLLVLVTNRDQLQLGGGFQFNGFDKAMAFVTRDSRGQEYIYGSGTIINAERTGDYQWGARYVLKLVIRAIPNFLWPDQYEDAKYILGIEGSNLSSNVQTLGWQATRGASTGLIPSVWKQFWWFYTVVMFLVGWVFGKTWRNAVTRGRIWLMIYVILLTWSLYLSQQTLQAWLWRIFYIGGITWGIWQVMVSPREHAIRRRGRVRERRRSMVSRVSSSP